MKKTLTAIAALLAFALSGCSTESGFSTPEAAVNGFYEAVEKSTDAGKALVDMSHCKDAGCDNALNNKLSWLNKRIAQGGGIAAIEAEHKDYSDCGGKYSGFRCFQQKITFKDGSFVRDKGFVSESDGKFKAVFYIM